MDNITIGQIMNFIKYLLEVVATIGALYALMNKLFIKPFNEKFDALNNNIELIKEGTLSNLKTSLIGELEGCIESGYVSFEKLEALEMNFKAYEKLGGNGYVKNLFETVEKLEKRKD